MTLFDHRLDDEGMAAHLAHLSTFSSQPEIPGFHFVVRGEPKAKGSMRAFIVKGRAVVTASAKGAGIWQKLIQFVLQDAWQGPALTGAVEVRLIFYLPRPKSAPKRVLFPEHKPDGDKLQRAVWDALTNIVIRDDAQIVDGMVSKRFADAEHPVGVEGWVRPLGE